MAVTPDGAEVYVTNMGSGTVSVTDTTTNTFIATVNAGSRPYSFGQFVGSALVHQVLPVANFSSNVAVGYVPLSVQFTDLSKNAIYGTGTLETERLQPNRIQRIFTIITSMKRPTTLQTVTNETEQTQRLGGGVGWSTRRSCVF